MKFLFDSWSWIIRMLSIPLWIIGHIHLLINTYDVVDEIFVSVCLNTLLAVRIIKYYYEEDN